MLEVYPGSAYLFADPTNADHDAELAAGLEASVIAWLDVVARSREAAGA